MSIQLWNPSAQAQIVNPKTGIKTAYFFNWLNALYNLLNSTLSQGFTGTVTIAKLTTGGTNGTLTYVNGVVTTVVPPT